MEIINYIPGISFDQNGISQLVKLKYISTRFNDKITTVIARFRKVGKIIVVDYKFKDFNDWFRAFEAHQNNAHYLILNNEDKLSIKTLIDILIIKSINIL